MTTTPTLPPLPAEGQSREENVLRLVEYLDRGTPEEVVLAVKAMLLISRPELAAYATALDIVLGQLGRVAPTGRIGRILGTVPILGALFRR